jgi:signal peptidase I
MKGESSMETETTKNIKRSPFWAGLLSVAATGLGHIYCGRIGKGLVLFFISFAFAPVIAASITTGSSNFALSAAIGSVLILISVFFYAVIDAVLTARKTPEGYGLKEYNRWYIYLMFIVVSLTYPTNLANTLKDHVIQAYKIPSASMVPNVLKHDYVLLNKAVYRKKSPEVGDVVIFVNPNRRFEMYMKRIVAMPGDTVEVKGRVVLINGNPLSYSPADPDSIAPIRNQAAGTVTIETNREARYAVMFTDGPEKPADFPKTTVPNGTCFLLGDNRDNSHDSRFFGPVSLADVLGRVDYIYKPAETWSRFGKYRDLK